MVTEGTIKTPDQMNSMIEAGKIVAKVLLECEKNLNSSISTEEIDDFLRESIKKEGAKPAFLGLYDFPATACISLNEEIVHGIPGSRRLKKGDIVSIDCGAIVDGMYSDHAKTYLIEESNKNNFLLDYKN